MLFKYPCNSIFYDRYKLYDQISVADNQRYIQACSMKPDEASMVLKMIESHEIFSVIGMNIYLDRDIFDQHVCGNIPIGEALVIFDIPRGIDMCAFYGEFHKALYQESMMGNPVEKGK